MGSTVPPRPQPLALNDVCNRYWQEVGQHHAARHMTFHLLGLLTRHFGKTRLLTDIRDNDVAKLVAWRRGHRVIRKKDAKPEECPFISARTVNDTTEQLKKLFTRTKLWGARFDHEPKWKEHWLKESGRSGGLHRDGLQCGLVAQLERTLCRGDHLKGH